MLRPKVAEIGSSTASIPKDTADHEVPSTDAEEKTLLAWKPSRRLYVVFLTLCIISLAAALDATSISIALPIMAQKLNGTAIEAFWAGTSFLLTSAVFQPLLASLSVIFGRKLVFLCVLAIFSLGAIVCAVATNFTVVLVGRSLQGIGGGGILALSEILVTDLVPLRQRGQYFGLLSMVWAVGSVSGPILGGAFSQNVSWRWIFYINLPLCGLGFALIPWTLKLHQQRSSLAQKLARIDWLGSGVFVASTTSLLLAISWGGVQYAWSSPRTLVPLILGVVGLAAFVGYEAHVPAEPMVRLSIFANRTAAATYLGTVCHGIILWCELYYFPLYFEGVRGFSPIVSGVALFPQTFTVAPASVAVGVIVSQVGAFRWAVWTGWCLTTVGMGMLTLLKANSPTGTWVGLNLVAGIGTGMLFPSMQFAVQASAADQDVPYAVAMFSFLRALGQGLGVAVGGVVFQNALAGQIRQRMDQGVGVVQNSDAVALVQFMRALPEGSLQKKLLGEAYTGALRVVWFAMLGFAMAGLLASLFTEGLSLDRELSTDQGLREKKDRSREVVPQAGGENAGEKV